MVQPTVLHGGAKRGHPAVQVRGELGEGETCFHAHDANSRAGQDRAYKYVKRVTRTATRRWASLEQKRWRRREAGLATAIACGYRRSAAQGHSRRWPRRGWRNSVAAPG